eukprot:6463867-Amphidinium_carterae.2
MQQRTKAGVRQVDMRLQALGHLHFRPRPRGVLWRRHTSRLSGWQKRWPTPRDSAAALEVRQGS